MKFSKSKICYDIVLCGTGATGSQLLPFLAQLLAFTEGNTLTLVDEDMVELKNCRNQKFLTTDESKYKAEVLCRRYNNVYPNVKIRCVTEYIKSKEQLLSLLPHSYTRVPILIGCVDNNPTRKIFGECFEEVDQLIYIDSGNGTIDRVGQVITSVKLNRIFLPSLLSEAWMTSTTPYHMFEEIKNDMDTVDTATSCGYQTDKNPQNIATNVMAASTIFSILTNIIMFNEVEPCIIYFDAEHTTSVRRPIETELHSVKNDKEEDKQVERNEQHE